MKSAIENRLDFAFQKEFSHWEGKYGKNLSVVKTVS